MKRTLLIAFGFSIILLGLLLIPLSGDVENTFVMFLGRFHPLILHVPIGALIALFFMEMINVYRPKLHLDSACKILLWFSVFSIIPAVIAGFLLASSGNYNDVTLGRHQWLGWFTALTCVWLLVLYKRKSVSESKKKLNIYRGFLFLAVILLSVTGHYGGSLTHGSNYLTKHMPAELKTVLGVEDSEVYIAFNGKGSDTNSVEALKYKNEVKPVMEKYCFECHGADKQKGDVRLDILHWDMINGPHAESWHTALDMINSGEMPPEDETQLENKERRALVDWMTSNLEKAAIAKQSENKGVMRRLTKAQYTNSLNDLLNVSVNFGDVLPNDGKSKMGFSNNGSILQTSALHIDYYQKIAREALDKSIVFGDKPKSTHYKLTIGEGIDSLNIGAENGGYQTAPIRAKDFLIDILDEKGNTVEGINDAEKASIIATKNKIGIGMRGSSSNRYTVVKEGMLLNSALPAEEKAPKSWQGPSPNMKLLIKQDFPRTGDFIFRVNASHGYHTQLNERLIDLRKKEIAQKTDKSIYILAKDIKKSDEFILKNNRWLMPKNVASFVQTRFTYNVKESGIYQVDLVHPYVSEDAMPSYRLGVIGGENIVSERLYMNEEDKNADHIETPVTLVYLNKGKHKGFVGGKFFVGFSQIVLTPLPENDPLPETLAEEAKKNSVEYKSINPSIQAFAGTRTDDGMDYKIFDTPQDVTAAFGDEQTFEFGGRLENLPIPLAGDQVSGDLANMMTVGLWNNYLVKKNNISGPPLLIKSIEFKAPYHPVWPPESHTSIFFDSPNKNDRWIYTREVLTRFMERAFRRTLKVGELNRYMGFWENIKDDYDRYEDGVKEVLVAVLCSPSFLYIFEPKAEEKEKESSENEFYLASQLSYFLWNAPPDETLTALAEENELHDGISTQVKRMVNDSKIKNMIHSFTYEWLRLDRQKYMDTDIATYPDYTRFVKEDMVTETYEFISHVLKNNLSILNFIDSDFAMLNQNLAEFYGVIGVEGNAFRPVNIEATEQRGGLLSQGAFLNGHSDGFQAHPIKRAVWLKDKILGDPPPPPPPNVPELDPETPGFDELTLKEQLFLHRNKASCLDCHHKIDPFGVVFENYDAVGRYQLKAKGRPIDSKSVLPDGTEVEGIQGIKKYILDLKKEDFTKSLVEHLYAYALGRDISFADGKEIDTIVEAVAEDDYRFQTVIEEIVLSPSFYKKENKSWLKIFGL